MKIPSGSRRFVAGIVCLVLVAAMVVALSETGVPVPGALVLTALVICAGGIVGAGALGYRTSRAEGHGIWGSLGQGARTSLRTVFELF